MRVFLSYRRADSRSFTERISDVLVEEFGEDDVFQDVDHIPPGDDFRRVLSQAVAECDCVLVVIGRQWINVSDEYGRRRIDNLNDFVRIEVESALSLNKLVIPLLVDNASMPTEEELPPGLKELAFRNAIPIRYNPDFNRDMARLITRLRSVQEAQQRAEEAVQHAERVRPAEATKPEEPEHLEREAAAQAEAALSTAAEAPVDSPPPRVLLTAEPGYTASEPEAGAARRPLMSDSESEELVPAPAGLVGLLLQGAAVILTLLVLLPVIWMIWASFSAIGGDGWEFIAQSADFSVSLVTTIVNGIVSAVIALIIGTSTAYGWFSLAEGRLKSRLILFFALPRIVPPFSLILPLFILFRNVGLLNTSTAVIILYVTLALPFAIWIMSEHFRLDAWRDGSKREPDSASRDDLLRRLRSGRAAALAAFALCLLVAWQDLAISLVMVTEQRNVIGFASANLQNTSATAAILIIGALPSLIAWFAVRRYLLGRQSLPI